MARQVATHVSVAVLSVAATIVLIGRVGESHDVVGDLSPAAVASRESGLSFLRHVAGAAATAADMVEQKPMTPGDLSDNLTGEFARAVQDDLSAGFSTALQGTITDKGELKPAEAASRLREYATGMRSIIPPAER